MRLLLSLFVISGLSGCEQASQDSARTNVALEKAKAEIAKLEKENTELKNVKASKITKPKLPKAETGLDDYDPEFGHSESATPRRNLCWQDYCPCDETVTALDITICRNARGGVGMSDDQWAIGAQARDSKREGDRLSREMDGILSEMNEKRY